MMKSLFMDPSRLSGPSKGSLLVPVAVLLLVGVAVSRPSTRQAAAAPPSPDLVARGEYLVTVGGCNDCHTPYKVGNNGPEPDMSRMLSGHPESLAVEPAILGGEGWEWAGTGTNTAYSGPWGVSFTANLTPHHTGLGAWTEDIFIAALRTGRHWGQSRPILPPMPWQNYGRMTDDDLRAVFAYLRSIPPVDNTVPLPVPPGGAEESNDEFLD